MKKGTQISDTEWTVMKVIWKDSPITANEVIEGLEESTDWSDRTIRTLLNRLVKKKVISYKKDGRRYLYYPIVTENECIKKENKSFLNRVYSGAVTLMFAKFLEEESLSDKEIEELKEILDKKKKR
ncbi:BlaI/MecI/CopY family transcriptional regulator [Dethiothermospora halolimnae]|uniref:BlaI/MecI/CopY family transcriptional regulator n=1 Tax=Dethiothermospora halolimnae TaxID=3114390 RepID=UPI003CCBC78D